jgi:hypothetical protein
MGLPPFLTVVRLVFEANTPEEDRENVLRRLMIIHCERDHFWIGGKSSLRGNTKRMRRKAPPQWNEMNRLRALELWVEEWFGPSTWNELKIFVRLGREFAPFLEEQRRKWRIYLEEPPVRSRGRPRGSKNKEPCPVIELFPRDITPSGANEWVGVPDRFRWKKSA